jgi:carboxyl-terminal processing protease
VTETIKPVLANPQAANYFAATDIKVFRMKKRVLYALLLLVLGANLYFGAQIYFYSAQAGEKDTLYEQMDVFVRVLEKVRQEYVDGEKVSYEELMRGALKGMLGTLDPHSEFMEPQKHEELKSDTEGNFGGVGLVVGLKDQTLTVISPMEDTPGYKAGILSGDRIVKIEGKSTEKIGLQESVHRLRGEPGTSITITISRAGWDEPKDFTLKRDHIKISTATDINGHHVFPLNEDKIGYTHLSQFGEQTTADLQNALKKMKDAGMKAMILDLRGNPGGLLPQAVKVCELFLPRNQLIVSTEGRSAQAKDEWHAKGHDVLDGMPMVILVNSGSASAAEIVAGCLQDVGRAFIMGEQTFGKGSVQTIIPLQDGSALRLTTAKYYTPSHKVIHERGITPDSIVPMSAEDEEAISLKRSLAVIEDTDEARRAKAQAARDVQIERANDFLKGMILYKDRGRALKKMAATKP